MYGFITPLIFVLPQDSNFNLLRASLLTVLRVVYATVWLSSMMIQKVDWPNTTPISQDKKTLTFKALP